MRRQVKDSVVVITGASSGIGRATALAFARSGATVVVAARREQALRELAAECERTGARALAVPTDVTDEAAVRELARRAVEAFGRIDVWVNNAAVTMFARFEEAPPDAFRRVIETNLFGYVYGARAALPYFRQQEEGVLINNSSIAGKVGEPYTSAYVVSKFGIRGLSANLRQEIRDPNIHVCTILPASIDTPIYQQGANFTGRAIKPIGPVYDAEQVARSIVGCVEHPQREIVVGSAGKAMALLHRLSLVLAERVMAHQGETDRFKDLPAPQTMGNLFEPMAEWSVVPGGWKARGGPTVSRVALVSIAAIVLSLLGWSWIRSGTAMARSRR